jgi:hypothetical protein
MLAGCLAFPATTYDVTTTIYVAPSASALSGRVMAAVDWLNREAGERVYEVLSARGEGRVDGAALVRIDDKLGCEVDEAPCMVGVTTRDVDGILIDLAPHPSLGIIAHELGHAAGLEHDRDPENFMYYLNPGLKMNAKQRAYLRELE